jgi:hypothetical protein
LRSAPKLAVHLQVRSCHHGTAQLRPERTAHLDISACSIHTQKHCAQASTHSPYTHYRDCPYTQHKHARTPVTPCLALPNASTGQPLYAHRDPVNIQSTRPSQPFRKLWHRCIASPAVPPPVVRATTNVLPFPSRAALALARASSNTVLLHWDMYRRTPTTQTTLLG